MIKFRCGYCNQKINAPDKYANSEKPCPKCKKLIRVPGKSQEPDATISSIIKFRCPGCNQKIGVTKDYAGKRVRCSRCKSPLRVPEIRAVESTKLESAVTGESDNTSEDNAAYDNIFDDQVTQELLAAEAGASEIETLQLKPETPREPSDWNSGLDPRNNLQSFNTEAIKDESSGLAKSLCKIPLAIGTSIGFTVGAAILWTIIASVFGLNWLHFLCVPVAGAAGYGLVLFTENRNLGLGLLAVLIGLFGIFCGKVFLAKWVILPQMENPFVLAGEEYDKSTLQEEQVQERLEDPKCLFRAVCFQLVEYGEFDREFAEKVVQANYDGRAPIGEAKQVQEGMRKVENTLGSWDHEQKRQAIIAQFERDKQMFKDFGKELLVAAADANEDELPEEFRNAARETHELFEGTRSIQQTKIGFAFAFVGSFSFLDLLFIPMGMWCAYKIGAGKE